MTPLEARWAVGDAARPCWRAILVVEGEIAVSADTRRFVLTEGELLLGIDAELTLSPTQQSALMLATGTVNDRIAVGIGASSPLRVLRPTTVASSMFAAVLNQGVTGAFDADEADFGAYWRTLEHAVSFLAQSGGSWIPEDLSPAHAEVFRRAVLFMEREHAHGDLSIAQISEGAYTSASSLFRAASAAATRQRLRHGSAACPARWVAVAHRPYTHRCPRQ